MTRRPCSHSPPDIWFFQILNKNDCLWQQATREITRSLLSSPLVRTINCSLASQALLEVTPRSFHRDHSIIACLRHICMGLILHTHPVCRESHNERNTNREVAIPLRHWHAYKQKAWQILQAWRNLSTFPSQLTALKSKLKFCHTVPSPRKEAFVGLVPPKQSFKPPQLKYKAL